VSGLAWAWVIGGCIAYALLTFWAFMTLEHRAEQRKAMPPTKPMPLSGLVIHPEQEKHAAWRASRLRQTSADLTEAIEWCGFCVDLSVVGDIAGCACQRPCGASWCGAPRRQAKTPGDNR
jgi:hypothetical protein